VLLVSSVVPSFVSDEITVATISPPRPQDQAQRNSQGQGQPS